MTENDAEELMKRRVRTMELAATYEDLEERAARLQHDREEFYRDVRRLRGLFAPESLAARLGLTRDAVYAWNKRGKALLNGQDLT